MCGKKVEKTFLRRPHSSLNLTISFARGMPIMLGFLIVGSPEIFLASKGAAYEVKPVWKEPSPACFPSELAWYSFSFSKIITVVSSFY